MRNRRHARRLELGAVLLLTLAGSTSLRAQWPEKLPPADSPAWWTLSPEITPDELRHLLLDPQKTQERYREAVARKMRPELPESRLQKLEYFVEGVLTPELVPAWEAYHVYAVNSHLRPSSGSVVREQLSDYGISSKAIDIILESLGDHWAKREELISEVGHQQQEFVKILRLAKKELGEQAYAQATASEDVEALAKIARRSPQEVRQLADAWNRDLGQEASISSIQTLRDHLSQADWLAHLTFLREQVAIAISGVEFRQFPD